VERGVMVEVEVVREMGGSVGTLEGFVLCGEGRG